MSKLIEKLTKKQAARVPLYYDKWVKNGLRTDPIDFEVAVSECKWLYKTFLKDHSPEPIVFLAKSPMQGMLIANALEGMLKNKPKELSSQLGSQLRSQLRSQLGSQLGSQLRSQLRSQLGSQLDSQLRSQLYSQNLKWFNYIAHAWYWAGYYGFYDFILHELLPKKRKEFSLFRRYIEHLGRMNWLIPLSGVCISVQRPTEIHFAQAIGNQARRLHREGGPAIAYEDGWKLHYLNGINVPDWAAETPVDQLTKDQIMGEKNADVRRELIRRIGPERLLKILDYKIIDAYEGYELITFDLGDGRVRPWLKMKNPSLDLMHIEGVRPEIKTVKDALCYRNGLITYEAPLALS